MTWYANGRWKERGDFDVQVWTYFLAEALSKRESATQVVVLKCACHALNFGIGSTGRGCYLSPRLGNLGNPAHYLSRIFER